MKRLCYAIIVMLITLNIALGVGAVFPDEMEITHREAVDKLAAMNIISGKADGHFDPNGLVTRAELCKMICIALNGGRNPALEAKEDVTYEDIRGHWGETYIEYCSALGMLSGYGDGTFAPDAFVTGEQAAKIILGAMNYDPSAFHFTGAHWAAHVNTWATDAGLYKDLLIDYSAPISRDDTAQLLYNGIQLPTVEYTWSVDPLTDDPVQGFAFVGRSILSKFPDYEVTGTPSIDTNYQGMFLDLLGKPISTAHKQFGQPIESISYVADELGFSGNRDVYPGITILYTSNQEIVMITITSSHLNLGGYKYGMTGSQIKEELGVPASISDLENNYVFQYDYESGDKTLNIKFTDKSFSTIKCIYFSKADHL